MASFQDSIENCSICQNSRKKTYFVSPHNYSRIFGYIGPASKQNINIHKSSRSSNKQKYPKKYHDELKKSNSRSSSKLFRPKNLDYNKRDKSEKFFKPGLFLFNNNARCCDEKKMCYDESDTDFEDLKKIRVVPKSKPTSKRNHNNNTGETSAIKKKLFYDSDMRNISPLENCSSIDSLGNRKVKKAKVRKVDSEDSYRKMTTSNSKKMKAKGKIKFQNKESICSIDSLKNGKKRTHGKFVNPPIDPEDRRPRIVSKSKNPQMKKPIAALTTSDYSVDSIRNAQKRVKTYKMRISSRRQTSNSSINLNPKDTIKNGIFGSIESNKHYDKNKKRFIYDSEDEMYSSPRKSLPKDNTSSINKKEKKERKKKRNFGDSKCYICIDRKFNKT